MPRSFLVKKRQDQLLKQQEQQSGEVNAADDDSLLRNYSNSMWNGLNSSEASTVGRASFSVGLSSSDPFNVSYEKSRDPASHPATTPMLDSAVLRNNSSIQSPLGHQKDQATNGAVDLRNFHLPNSSLNSSPCSFAHQVATASAAGTVLPPIGRELFAAAWLAELHRLYFGGGFMAAAASSVMTSPFPLAPSTVRLSLAGQERMLMQQPLHGSVAPSDAGLCKGEHDTLGGLTGRCVSETRRQSMATSPNDAAVSSRSQVLTDLSEQKRCIAANGNGNGNGNETKCLEALTAYNRRRAGLNDFSIPSILAGKSRFGEQRRRDESGSVGSCGGATSGADSEDAWSSCTRSPYAEQETLSKLSSSDSEVFDEDRDLRGRSADRRREFQTAVDNSSTVQQASPLYHFLPPISGSCPTPLFVRPFPPTSPMSSTSSSMSTSPPICFRDERTRWASGVTSSEDNKRWNQKQRDDLSTAAAEVVHSRGLEGKPLARQTMIADSSSRHYECPQCDKVYSSIGALKMHIRTHTLPCQCPLCGKAFSRPWLLQGHLRTHTGERPFRCQQCDRAFADRSNLRAHLQTHANVKRYRCDRCSKAFSRASLLTKHQDGNCAGALGLFSAISMSGNPVPMLS